MEESYLFTDLHYYKNSTTGELKTGYIKEPPKGWEFTTKEVWDEAHPAPVVHEPTPAEKEKARIRREIALKKAELAKTDYKCLKYVDGALTEEEYAPVKAKRQTLRDEINELEGRL